MQIFQWCFHGPLVKKLSNLFQSSWTTLCLDVWDCPGAADFLPGLGAWTVFFIKFGHFQLLFLPYFLCFLSLSSETPIPCVYFASEVTEALFFFHLWSLHSSGCKTYSLYIDWACLLPPVSPEGHPMGFSSQIMGFAVLIFRWFPFYCWDFPYIFPYMLKPR